MKRTDIEEKYKWKLEDIVESDKKWETLFTELTDGADALTKYSGKLRNAESVLSCLRDSDEQGKKLERLYAYAKMRHDEDTKDAKYKSMCDRIENLYVKISAKNSFLVPELSALPEAELSKLAKDLRLSDYDYFLNKIIEDKKYILSEKEERLLALGGEVFGSFSEIFSMIDNADIKFDDITDKDGKEYDLSHAKYSLYMQNPDSVLRENAFKAYYKPYIDNIHTIAQVYSSNVKKDWYLAKARGYDSCMQKALKGEDVDSSVYDNLIESVGKGLKPLHRYVALRKKILKKDILHMYDMYLPIVDNAKLELDYEDACKLVKKALAPLGEGYEELLDTAFSERWIDVYESSGKRSGAYSFGSYVSHPFVLLNYEKTTHDVFTIAHELGHSLHSYYSNKKQPYAKADYTIFVAEVASTVNEVLLLKHIIASTKDENIKKYFLSYYLDMFRTTLFRQTMFSEFEAIVHKMTEEGQPLGNENMSEIYLKLNKKYYGSAVTHDEEIKYEWSRIPHFYRSFYVYKYATGITCAVSIAKAILSEGDPAVKRYKEFLSLGGSDSPVKLLQIAGVDLTGKQPFDDAMQEFEETLYQLENM